MEPENRNAPSSRRKRRDIVISRRLALGSSGLAVLGLVSGSAMGRQEVKRPPQGFLERMEQSRAFSERMRNAASAEERAKITEERSAWERTRAVEDLKEQLGVSDQEWSVIKPRVEAVYSMVHAPQRVGRADGSPTSPMEQRTRELRELLSNKETKLEDIKAKLTALRAAKEEARRELLRVREGLRQIMTLRQEAVLVLNGLLE